MANEITLSCLLSYIKGGVSLNLGKSGLRRDVAGEDSIHNTQTIGTSEEALQMGDIAAAGGYMYIRNTDSTNFVTLRAGTGEADLVRLNAGDIAIFRLASAGPYAIADTAAVLVEYAVIEA